MTNEASATRKGTLLVASDDAKMIAELRDCNGQLGLDLDVVAKGKELLDRLQPKGSLPHEGESGWIKVLLLDDDVADGRGRSFLRALRGARPDLKIIFTTAAGSSKVEVEARSEGVYFFLPKPIDRTILTKVIAKAVEHESTRNRWKVG